MLKTATLPRCTNEKAPCTLCARSMLSTLPSVAFEHAAPIQLAEKHGATKRDVTRDLRQNGLCRSRALHDLRLRMRGIGCQSMHRVSQR